MARLAFYSHDTFGLGHLSRCLKLAGSLLPVTGPAEGLILTGSPWARLFQPPVGFRFVELPPVIKRGRTYGARRAGEDVSRVLARRRRIVEEAVDGFRPDLLLVDNVPCGLRGEALAALESQRRGGRPAVLVLRDVLDDPAAVEEEWSRAGAAEALDRLFTEIWFFGERRALAPLTAGPLKGFAHKVVVCGALGDPRRPRRSRRQDSGRPRVLVTGGGGGDAGHLVGTYLELLERYRPPVESHLVLGPDFPVTRFRARQAGRHREVLVARFLPDLAGAMRRADLVVSMAGYNTICELRAAGRPAVLVPRVWPRREQLLRATAMERGGGARMLLPGQLTADTLWAAIEEMIAAPPPEPETLPGGAVAARQARILLGAA